MGCQESQQIEPGGGGFKVASTKITTKFRPFWCLVRFVLLHLFQVADVDTPFVNQHIALTL